MTHISQFPIQYIKLLQHCIDQSSNRQLNSKSGGERAHLLLSVGECIIGKKGIEDDIPETKLLSIEANQHNFAVPIA